MPWIKIDDKFHSHPKVIAAGAEGVALYVVALSWCGEYLTDGFIPEAQVRRLSLSDNYQATAAHLVSVGLWDIANGGYQIHDYLEYNPSAEQVKADREANAKRQADWRTRQAQQSEEPEPNGGNDDTSNGDSNGVTNGVTNTAPIPIPVPIPNPEPEDIAANAAQAPPKTPPKQPGPPKPKPAALTDNARAFLGLFSAKRFANKAQREAVLDLERQFPGDFLACARWAAEQGVGRGKAIGMMRTALPKWNKPKGGNDGQTGRSSTPRTATQGAGHNTPTAEQTEADRAALRAHRAQRATASG